MRPIDYVYKGKKGEKAFLLGNEAIVRGALEGGLQFASTYPGTPSSEIGNVLSKIAKKVGIYFEFSTNEKVAMEVAGSAASSGLRSMTFFKHVGLNVAADAYMSLAYIGVKGGMLIVSADDPSMHSSQNEQDNRYYALLANIPMLEPSTPQEAKDMARDSFEISEELGLPVLMRTTTRVNHVRGVVELGEIKKIERKGHLDKDPSKYVPVPSNARKMHPLLLKKMERARKISERSEYNFIIDGEEKKFGIITSGVAYNYVHDYAAGKIPILKLGFTNPLPEKKIAEFLKDKEKILIVEELEPYLEREVRRIAQMEGIEVKIYGKYDGIMPRYYEYNPDVVKSSLSRVFGMTFHTDYVEKGEIPLPSRPPVLCPGCPHRATYYSVKKALQKKKIKVSDVIFPTDIGCYTLGIQKPYEMADYLLCMGSSAGTACGFSKATDQRVISFVGDSTFFHASIPAMINAKHNKQNFIYVILDNRTTAMTGFQPHPGLPVDGMGDEAPMILPEDITKGLGIPTYIVDPYDIKETQKTFEEVIEKNELSVVIARQECALLRYGRERKQGTLKLYTVDQEKCTKCKICVSQFACPAIYIDENGDIRISDVLCTGCGVCVDVCPFNAIKEVSKE